MRRSFAFAIMLLALTHAVAQETESGPSPAPNPESTEASPPAASQPAAGATAPAQAPAQAQPQAAPPRNRLYTWGSVGTTFAYGQTYGNLSVGAGLLMQKGLAPNVELSYNFGSSPTLWTLRPGVTWYLPVARFHPYIGGYYTHWFVSGNFPDQNGIGARGGFSLGRVLSLAVTYDHALNCDRNCDIWTPQVSAGVSF